LCLVIENIIPNSIKFPKRQAFNVLEIMANGFWNAGVHTQYTIVYDDEQI